VSLAIVWFRRDLRLEDNPALAAALSSHRQVLPLYIYAPQEEAPWQPGAAARWWLHYALDDLSEQLAGNLLIRSGDSLAILLEIAERSGATAVYWNRLYEPAAIARDTEVKQRLRAADITAESRNAALLFEPWEIKNKQGLPFRVFTPFWKRLLEAGLPQAPDKHTDLRSRIVGPTTLKGIDRCTPESLKLLPTVRWDSGMHAAWRPTRAAAEARLEEFVATELHSYAQGRDLPASDQVSRLSPYLHFGQLGPREVVSACRRERQAAAAFLRELGWREFAHHLLFHFPHTAEAALDSRFAAFPWREDAMALQAWQHGNTGIPLVDAGMRQLWATGWMHNRVRMIVASLLTKNLLLPWQAGASWFWDTLVDADLASNSLGWQWTAGCGADAAPYFRVFNPVLQGEKFDPDGGYVRRWVPALSAVPTKWIHRPWDAPDDVLADAGVELGRDYPHPIVDLKASRQRALDAWSTVK
jgi:deoxyribodipyrimidine photo-lyase